MQMGSREMQLQKFMRMLIKLTPARQQAGHQIAFLSLSSDNFKCVSVSGQEQQQPAPKRGNNY